MANNKIEKTYDWGKRVSYNIAGPSPAGFYDFEWLSGPLAGVFYDGATIEAARRKAYQDMDELPQAEHLGYIYGRLNELAGKPQGGQGRYIAAAVVGVGLGMLVFKAISRPVPNAGP